MFQKAYDCRIRDQIPVADGGVNRSGMWRSLKSSVLVAVALIILSGQVHGRALSEGYKDIPAYLASKPQFSTLSALLIKSKLSDTLKGPDTDVTLFAPTNAAFTPEVKGYLDKLSTSTLAEVLRFHLAPKVLKSSSLKTGRIVTTKLEDFKLVADRDAIAGKTLIRGYYSFGQLKEVDIKICKSRIHVVDAVLLPYALEKPKYSSIYKAAKGMGLNIFVQWLEAYKPSKNDFKDIKPVVFKDDGVGTVFAYTDDTLKVWATSKSMGCTSIDDVPPRPFVAFATTSKFIPPARLYTNRTIDTFNYYNEDGLDGIAQQLKVVYFKQDGKATIWGQFEFRDPTAAFFQAKITKTVYAGKAVMHILDNVLYPLQGWEGCG